MPLIGTISGSNRTSNTAITGTLVVANTSVSFPTIPSDSILYAQGRIVGTSDLVSSAAFRSLNSTGDEGGEIFLNKAVTNTTLTTGVTIDIYQNRLRIFETGGTNRGGYFDISSLGAGVVTNLGSVSAAAAGSTSEVQFNNGGAFASDPVFTFGATTKTLGVSTGSFHHVTSSLVYGKVFASGLVTLTDAASISWDLSQGSVAQVTLGGTRTLSAPTNQTAGGSYTLIVKQDSAGNKTLAFDTTYKFPGSTDPTITTASNAVDILTFISDGTSMYGSYVQNFG
jgi:hypothetical protein